MRIIWGAVTEINDLGVVAEQCPHCERFMPCLLRSVCRANYVLFMRMAAPTGEHSVLCTGCLKTFPCEQYWRYASVVTIPEAKGLPLEELQARTNPMLAERLKFKEQVRELGGDPRFAVGYEQLETMRPGPLRSDLLRQLLDWDRLAEEQRALLAQQIGARARAWQLARHLGPGFPRLVGAGCLALVAAGLVVALAFLAVPAIRSWLWGTVTVAAGLIAATLFNQGRLTQLVRGWTRDVLIPEAQDAEVSFDSFVAVVDDVPESRLGLTDELWPMKYHLDTIRAVLIADGKLSHMSASEIIR